MANTVKTNPRGIPHAPFVSDVVEHIGGPDVEIESTLKQFQEAIAKYRYMELNLSQRRKALDEKIPDIKKTLTMVQFLQDRREGRLKGPDDVDDLADDLDEDSTSTKPLTTAFELNDTLYAEAELDDTEVVYLWLGANVMLSYSLSEATELLSTKLFAAEQNRENAIQDLEFLREQITVMEVNTARVYNWDVKRRRERRQRGQVDQPQGS
ncbi:prefoldin subunit [Hysterangium stoloniferum]|nr:prefoldin subunit [Hysterangium stoloniferum]